MIKIINKIVSKIVENIEIFFVYAVTWTKLQS